MKCQKGEGIEALLNITYCLIDLESLGKTLFHVSKFSRLLSLTPLSTKKNLLKEILTIGNENLSQMDYMLPCLFKQIIPNIKCNLSLMTQDHHCENQLLYSPWIQPCSQGWLDLRHWFGVSFPSIFKWCCLKRCRIYIGSCFSLSWLSSLYMSLSALFAQCLCLKNQTIFFSLCCF